mmetsp:Transcript_35032/g.87357  ORF Transcript_35032/g.87357 Transcript_35032/m.87357 type:complete len:238 (+) Transcript_35032:1673-2386(+)
MSLRLVAPSNTPRRSIAACSLARSSILSANISFVLTRSSAVSSACLLVVCSSSAVFVRSFSTSVCSVALSSRVAFVTTSRFLKLVVSCPTFSCSETCRRRSSINCTRADIKSARRASTSSSSPLPISAKLRLTRKSPPPPFALFAAASSLISRSANLARNCSFSALNADSSLFTSSFARTTDDCAATSDERRAFSRRCSFLYSMNRFRSAMATSASCIFARNCTCRLVARLRSSVSV